MNVDQSFRDMSIFESYSPIKPQIDNLPQDYFYSNDYDYLTLPEVQLLLALSDSQFSYSFSGLRKMTSLHQHQLSKALKRLQDRDYLIKSENGTYELTDSGSKYTRELLNDLVNKKAIIIESSRYYTKRKKLKFIPPFERETLVDNFEGRWFGDFRYLYKKDANQNIELCWEDKTGNRVHIYINQVGEVDVEYRSLQPDYSNFQRITNWIRNDVSNQSDVSIHIIEQEIRENMNKIPYN